MVRGRKAPRDKGRHWRSEKDVSGGEGSDKEDDWKKRELNQRRPLGMPSDSDSESGSGSDTAPSPPPPQNVRIVEIKPKVIPKAEEEEEEESSSSSGDDALLNNEYFRGPSRQALANREAKQEKKEEAIVSSKEMARLAEIRRKREEDRQKRIAVDGWDRYAPVTASNKPPAGYVPHPEPSSP